MSVGGQFSPGRCPNTQKKVDENPFLVIMATRTLRTLASYFACVHQFASLILLFAILRSLVFETLDLLDSNVLLLWMISRLIACISSTFITFRKELQRMENRIERFGYLGQHIYETFLYRIFMCVPLVR